MESSLKKRRTLKGRLTRIETTIGGHGDTPLDPRLVERYQQQLEQLWTELNSIHDDISQECDDAGFAAHQNEYDQLSARIEALQLTLPTIRNGNQERPIAEANVPINHQATVRLPRLDLPTFSGNLHEWTSFYDLFTATIHANEQLSGAQKLQYLKSSLRGEAATLIQSIQVTDENFGEAWDILKQRYNNRREIVNAHLKRLFAQTTLQSEGAIALRKLIDTTNETVRSLRVLEAPVEHWDLLLVHIVSEKLDMDSRRQWELTLQDTEFVRFADFTAFLEQRARALMTCCAPRANRTTGSGGRNQERQLPGRAAHHAGEIRGSCRICQEPHAVFKCPEFVQASIQERRGLIKTHSLCYNCLSTDHVSRQCKAGSCRKCGERHNTLLHAPAAPRLGPNPGDNNTNATTHHGAQQRTGGKPAQVLLATALVRVRDKQGIQQVFRALLDQGSQASFITESCAQRLGLPRERAHVTVTGVNASNVSVAKGSIRIKIMSCVENSDEILVHALILKKVTGIMPSVQYNPDVWKHLPKNHLADPDFHIPNPIDLLLGADVVAEVIRQDLRRGTEGTPVAQGSSLGWIVSGGVNTGSQAIRVTTNTAQLELVEAVQKFWELEEIPKSKPLSEEEARCEQHFMATYKRNSEGRFIVRLPLKTDQVIMEPRETRTAAVQRLLQVERRLAARPQQQQEYREFLNEYEQLGHMKLMSTIETSSIYLPHHGVIKEASTSTRLRVVFDASAKGRNGLSLNDHLMVGPTLQEDIFTILIRFRTHAIAITADIHKMYRQVLINEADTQYQNIVWRPSPLEPIRDYRLATLTYGTSSAPFLATRCLQQLAREEGNDLPEAATVAQRDFYVDDLLSGAETEDTAIELTGQLITLLNRGGFQLCKWTSSSERVINSVPVQHRAKTTSHAIDSDDVIKTLGLQWSPFTDTFSFRIAPQTSMMRSSRRSILSTLARIYDPLGWLSPTTVKAKILLQKLWRFPCAWDDELPKDVEEEWMQYLTELCLLESIKIPRRLHPREQVQSQELHGFCDASERAYAAVIYLKSKDKNGRTEVTLVAAKTRVAPLKTISIPRLELCSALLLAQLFESIQESFHEPCPVIHAWTDSTVTLAWINAISSRWKTFVANRVTKIQSCVPADRWSHVKGNENPADCASRGLNPHELEHHKLWWTGPDWLLQEHFTANQPESVEANEHVAIEERSSCVTTTETPQPLLRQFSSLSKLKRVTAYMFRFIHNCRLAVSSRISGPLSREELELALVHWIRITQHEVFPHEIKCLTDRKALQEGSRLNSLNPFLDPLSLIRVGGRLRNASITIDRKFPIVLPRKHALTTLIVRHEHLRQLHAGAQLLLCALQQHYWILGGRDVIRQQVRECVICWRQRASPPRPVMAQLPAARVNPGRPFQKCGVDYAGPITLRALKLRGQKTYKAYIALFVCFTTHAIHLEVVSDLTTDAFIAALKRFVARRGHCNDVYSDQGTNFVGANHELKVLRSLLKTPKHNETVAHFLGNSGINWHFIPPAAPHFGGLWEAGVKAVKHHLRRVVGNVSLNFEEMNTVLTQIEACLNSRPLCPMSTSPDDLSTLTPGHFLIGGPLTTIAEPDYTFERIARLSRWQLVQQMYQHFWKRWSREFLARLQQRPRSWTSKIEIKQNDLVLIKEDNLPPSKWKLGRIVQVHPGSDGVVRVVTVKTQSGELRRPVVKVCPLPINDF